MKVSKEMLKRWEKYCRLFCMEHGLTPEDIKSCSMAWTIADKLDIPKEAYHVGMNDIHIATGLRRIFPNAHV